MNASMKKMIGSAATIAGVTAMLAGTGVAHGGPLPGGMVREDLGGGTSMVARLMDEQVSRPGGNVANVPTSREVFVSGTVRVAISGKAKSGVISGGYVIGCQVDLSGGLTNSGTSTTNGETVTSATAGSVLTLGPGQAMYVPIIDQPNYSVDADNPFAKLNGYKFRGNAGSVTYGGQVLRVNGCGGYAQARARMTILVNTDTAKSQTTLWGKPFSLG